jgi:hypothetical protein
MSLHPTNLHPNLQPNLHLNPAIHPPAPPVASHPVAHLHHLPPRLHTVGTGQLLDPALRTLHVVPWSDPLVDRTGHDPRGDYVERFWLACLGPSTTWLIRTFSWGFATSPQGFNLDLPETAKALGMSDRLGRNSPFVRSITRACQFDLAAVHSQHPSGTTVLRARTTLPWLSRRLAAALPATLREEHQAWLNASNLAAERSPERR